MYNSLVWNTALGASFVGYGSATFFLFTGLFTSITSACSTKCGQMPVIAFAMIR